MWLAHGSVLGCVLGPGLLLISLPESDVNSYPVPRFQVLDSEGEGSLVLMTLGQWSGGWGSTSESRMGPAGGFVLMQVLCFCRGGNPTI